VLSERIQYLEKLLKERSAFSPVRSGAERAAAVNFSAIDMSPASNELPPPYSAPEGESSSQISPSHAPGDSLETQNAEDAEPVQASVVVGKLIPSPIRFDMASGRVRYFGPTTSMNLLSKSTLNKTVEHNGGHWPISMLVRDLSLDTHDYLMELFWRCHNSVIHLVHLDTFYHNQDRGGTEFYSTFLHLTMLATGYRYADKTRHDIQQLFMSGPASSTLHEKAKVMAKLEIDRPGGITAIQAFSLLGDLELYCGRDDTGWMFTGWWTPFYSLRSLC
jgi:hypothetical protein